MKIAACLLMVLFTFAGFAKTTTTTCENTAEGSSFVLVTDLSNAGTTLKVTLDGMQDYPNGIADFQYTGNEIKSAGSSILFVKKGISSSEVRIQKINENTVLAILTSVYTKVDDAKMISLMICSVK